MVHTCTKLCARVNRSPVVHTFGRFVKFASEQYQDFLFLIN